MRNLFYLGAVLTGFAGFALADDEKVPKPRPSITAVRVEQLPVIDGVLDEAAWQAAPVAGDFVQQDPDNGEPITERTEFRVLYDDKALYIGVWCYDSEPDEIIARSMMRDDYPYEDDHLYIAIDSFLDYRNGYAFATNPNSCRWDGLIINNSYTGGSWDAIWECKSRITGEGWFSEIAIPFNSISFDPNQTAWGLNISRTIRRKNETGRWHNPPRQLWTSSVSDAGEIRGLNNLSQDSKWELLPYGMGKYRHNHDLNDGSTLGDFGGDISYKLAPNLSASLSANTDFAETEVDSRQLNFSRFSLFYPEKRDFFLRDSGIFRFGSLSRSSSVPTIPFFSRRIGLTENQRPVPINLAAKVTGRIGKYSIGIIDAQIDGHDGIGSQNAFVTRVSRNVLEQSSVGLITTIGNPNSEEDAYLIGTDFNYRTTRFLTDKTLRASVYALANYDESSDWSEVYGGSLTYPNDLLDGGLAFYEVGEDFQPKLGYTRRTGAYVAGFFHLTTHAAFKAALFLCSGSVIHAMHHAYHKLGDHDSDPQDMRNMGGMKSKMKITFLTMFMATLALSGVPFMSGFLSKDAILAGTLSFATHHPEHFLLPLFGFGAALLTAFYMFRLIFMTFYGKPAKQEVLDNIHESPTTMTTPLIVLATLSIFMSQSTLSK